MSENTVQNAAAKKLKGLNSRKIQRGIFIALMLSVGILQFLIFWVYVNFNSILMAFQLNTKTGIVWTLENFTRFFHEFSIPEFELALALRNTLLMFVVGTVIGLPTSLLFSYYLYKKILFAKFFRVTFFLPSIISAAVLVSLFKYILAVNGPFNEVLSWIVGKTVEIEWVTDEAFSMGTILFYIFWTGFGTNIVLFTGAIYRIPQDVLEYAKLDGVSMTRELVQIVVPLIWPTISTLLVFATAGLFTTAGPILLFTDGQAKTMTIGFFIFKQVTNNSYYYPAAIGLLFTAIGFPLVIIVKWTLGKVLEDVEY